MNLAIWDNKVLPIKLYHDNFLFTVNNIIKAMHQINRFK